MLHGNNEGFQFFNKTSCSSFYEQMQQANKVMSSSPGLKDFAPGGVDGILHLPDGQVKLFWINIFEKIQITEELKGIKLLLIFIFSAESTIGMVRRLTPLKHYGTMAIWQ